MLAQKLARREVIRKASRQMQSSLSTRTLVFNLHECVSDFKLRDLIQDHHKPLEAERHPAPQRIAYSGNLTLTTGSTTLKRARCSGAVLYPDLPDLQHCISSKGVAHFTSRDLLLTHFVLHAPLSLRLR